MKRLFVAVLRMIGVMRSLGAAAPFCQTLREMDS